MDDINEFKCKLEVMESHNQLLGKNLVTVDQERQQIIGYMSEDFGNRDWDSAFENFGKHVENSNRMVQMMKVQNEITQDNISTTREILESLENTHVNTKFLRYRDWVAELIVEIVVKLGKMKDVNGSDAWANISRAFSVKIMNEMVDFEKEAVPYIQLLSEVLDKTSITLEDFELLMRLKWKSNNEFHLDKSQTVQEALEELEQFVKSPPDGFQDYVVPVQKAVYTVKNWRYVKKN
jgi:hypothetical protein